MAGSLTASKAGARSVPRPTSRQDRLHKVACGGRAHFNVVRLCDRKGLIGNPRGGSTRGGRRLKKEKSSREAASERARSPRGTPGIEVFRRM
ncbi:hypothetical protein NDU88_001650 [Pleurodeles waltl]|uniref:Uncharacterized protein n=1 Tax=Pleurodeles waltl TaxID=8319 RepID=A0AAV7LBL8_PLEWA|nr:hypothetical protein NDU88_001650 [Pleurodeles waltl]